MPRPLVASAVRLVLALALLSGDTSAQAPTPYTVQPGDWLSTVARAAYGDSLYWPAILLATNDGTGDPAVTFIATPNLIYPGDGVLLPSRGAADSLMIIYTRYERAVADMVLPEPWEASPLIPVRDPAAETWVTWSRDGLEPGRQTAQADIWVTLSPHLQNFCRALPPGTDLELRLEQRLGLPPSSGKEVFVTLEVSASTHMFRPCADPSLDSDICRPGTPSDATAPDEYVDWFMRQYRTSYGTERPVQYPWTSLGYTFDWGGADEVGENEFVIPEGDTITVSGVYATDDYCRA